MKLRTINKWLRRIGLSLSVVVDWESRCAGLEPSPTEMFLDFADARNTIRKNQEYEEYWEKYGPRPSGWLQKNGPKWRLDVTRENPDSTGG